MNYFASSMHRARSHTQTACRSCGSGTLLPVLDLGITPLAGRPIAPERIDEEEMAFPLFVVFCPDCALVQITETVAPEILFADAYPYFSSFSPALVEHARQNVLARLAKRNLTSGSLVMEIASNDGYLLQHYAQAGIPVMGIDPAEGPARAAQDKGIATIVEFLTAATAGPIAAQHGQADIIHANNVLAHVSDTNGFIVAIRTLLKPEGQAVLEFPYLRDLIENVEFDTIYHEHLCYFSLHALDRLFRRHGLYINDVERLHIHGGSLRIFVEHNDSPGPAVAEMLAQEEAMGLTSIEALHDFSDKVETLRAALCDMVASLRDQGKSIAAYGAAAKGATLLNYCVLDWRAIDFVVDRNTHKQGLLMPGAHIPILAPEALAMRKPDYALMLTWNFADEIIAQQQPYLAAGGKFIIPVPLPAIVE